MSYEKNIVYQADALTAVAELPPVDCVITSPPYWQLRDYGVANQIGLENDFNDYIDNLVTIFNNIPLKDTGTLWVNLGDTYGTQSGNMRTGKEQGTHSHVDKIIQPKTIHKSLLLLPSRFALAMIDAGWILRNEIIWYKKNQMPSPVKDRFTVDFEKIYFFVKQSKGYYFVQQLEKALGYDGRKDIMLKRSLKYGNKTNAGITKPKPRWRFKKLQDDGQETNTMHENSAKGIPDKYYPIRNMRAVWDVNTKPYPDAHFAVYPEKLVARMIKAGCPENGLVFDPFMGSGTTGLVARKLGRNFIGFDANQEYVDMANKRIFEYERQGRLF